MADDDSEATRESDVTGRSDDPNLSVNRHPSAEDADETADETAAEAASESGGVEGADRELPPVLNVRDSLDRIEREADADVSDELSRARSLLDEYENRGGEAASSGDSLADDLDGVVVAVRERVSGDADRYAEAIENRLQTYRNERNDASETVTVSSPHLFDGDERLDNVARRGGETATLDATLVNEGDGRDGVARLTFYDADDDPVRRVRCLESDLSTDEHRQIRATVAIPDGAEYYDVTALDAAETATPER